MKRNGLLVFWAFFFSSSSPIPEFGGYKNLSCSSNLPRASLFEQRRAFPLPSDCGPSYLSEQPTAEFLLSGPFAGTHVYRYYRQVFQLSAPRLASRYSAGRPAAAGRAPCAGAGAAISGRAPAPAAPSPGERAATSPGRPAPGRRAACRGRAPRRPEGSPAEAAELNGTFLPLSPGGVPRGQSQGSLPPWARLRGRCLRSGAPITL